MFFQNTFIPRVVALAVGCGLVIGSGCDGIGDDPPGDPNAEAAEKVVTDLSVIRSQGERLTAMIEDGEAVETVLQSLVESLAVEPRVESAALDADGRRVETVFKSGMNHAFVVIDEAEQLAIPDETVEETVVPKASAKVAEVDDVTGGRLFQESRVWFPASNKALIATSSTVVDPIYGEEVRDLFEKMLKDRGYDVKPKEATVELFKSLTQYGVIILITTPNGTKWVTTTTPVPTDAESLRPYAKDLLEKAELTEEPAFLMALEAILNVLPAPALVSSSSGPLASAAADADALEKLRKLAFAKEVPAPKQLGLL